MNIEKAIFRFPFLVVKLYGVKIAPTWIIAILYLVSFTHF
jgi:hypothetical protein